MDATGVATDADGQKVGVAEVVKIDDNAKVVLKSSSSKIQDDEGTKAKITDDTTIWVHTTTATTTTPKYSVTKEAFADYTRTTNDLAGTHRMFAFVNVANVTDILILEGVDTDGNTTAFAVGDTKDVDGLVLGYTTKVDADGNENRLDTVTIQTPDGVKTTYEADGTDLALPDGDAFARLAVNKSSDKINNVKIRGWDETTQYLNATKNYSKLDQVITNAGYKIEAASESLILFRELDSNGKWKYTNYTMGQINTNKKELALMFHTKYYDSETGIYTADLIVVQETTLNTLTLTGPAFGGHTPKNLQYGYSADTVTLATPASLSSVNGRISYYVVNSSSDKLTLDSTTTGTVAIAAGLAVGRYTIEVGAHVTVIDGAKYEQPEDETTTLVVTVGEATNTLIKAAYTAPAAKAVGYTSFDVPVATPATVDNGTVVYSLSGNNDGISINASTGQVTVAAGLAAGTYAVNVVQTVTGVETGHAQPAAQTTTFNVEVYTPVATTLSGGMTATATSSTTLTITGAKLLDQKGNAMANTTAPGTATISGAWNQTTAGSSAITITDAAYEISSGDGTLAVTVAGTNFDATDTAGTATLNIGNAFINVTQTSGGTWTATVGS